MGEHNLYQQLKHIYDQYAEEWTEHNRSVTANVLKEFEDSLPTQEEFDNQQEFTPCTGK
jgi:hypothetical protein